MFTVARTFFFFFKNSAMYFFVDCRRNQVTMYIYAWEYEWMNAWDISHLSSVYPNLLSELGDDSAFCNAIVFPTFPPWRILICLLFGSLWQISHLHLAMVVGIMTFSIKKAKLKHLICLFQGVNVKCPG